MYTLLGKQLCHFHVCLLSKLGLTLNEYWIISPRNTFFLKGWPHFGRALRNTNQQWGELLPFVKPWRWTHLLQRNSLDTSLDKSNCHSWKGNNTLLQCRPWPGPQLYSIISLTYFYMETRKRVIGKQCRPRLFAIYFGVWSGSTLFAKGTFPQK